ncbi:MAG: hypothetical protein PHT62_14615, partial [Desulfotomaculaceae bacterium]|nr:hypothetical protein [Desulfotomaculaceae bacterium]
MINVDKQEAEDGKIISIFAYIIFLIPWLAGKDNRFAQYHANQGLVLFLTALILALVNILLGLLFSLFGYVGYILASLVSV